MKTIINHIASLGINSFSELAYVNKRTRNVLTIIGITLFVSEGILLEKKGLIISGFFLLYCLWLFPDYKNKKRLDSKWHYIMAGLFFIAPVVYAGFWSLPIPILLTAFTYLKYKDKDIHLLVLEVALVINTQIPLFT